MAVLFTVLCGAAALCLGYYINFFARGHFVHSTDAILDSQRELVEANGLPEDGASGEYLHLRLTGHSTIPGVSSADVERFAEGIVVFTYPPNGRLYAAKIYTLGAGAKALIGFNITGMARDFRLMQLMGICSILFVMLVVFVSFLISIFVVRGTNRIAETAHEIMQTGDLSRRIEIRSRWDDLSNMAATLNALLARIEDLLVGIRRVSDNIAHDLRTPLTRMRNRIETLNDKHGDADHSALLRDADHLLSTFTALLRIARIETEKRRSHFMSVRLDRIVDDACAFYEPLAEDKKLSLIKNLRPADIHGDKDLLFQAFANILDNAIKFTPYGGTVTVSMEQESRVIIEDSGPGVDEAETEKIFDRFYRAEKSRTTAGTGLGLSLVKAVIELHGGTVRAENTKRGLRIITDI